MASTLQKPRTPSPPPKVLEKTKEREGGEVGGMQSSGEAPHKKRSTRVKKNVL